MIIPQQNDISAYGLLDRLRTRRIARWTTARHRLPLNSGLRNQRLADVRAEVAAGELEAELLDDALDGLRETDRLAGLVRAQTVITDVCEQADALAIEVGLRLALLTDRLDALDDVVVLPDPEAVRRAGLGVLGHTLGSEAVGLSPADARGGIR